MKRPKILFVDDEADLLAGLRLSLRKLRNEWDMVFVEGATKAWPHALEGVDIVVTDLRMPGMNGADFLKLVQRGFPTTTRIVLSGYANQDMALEAIGVAHGWLHKPSTTPAIVEALRRAVRARAAIEDDRLRRIVFGARAIPSYPRRYAEVSRLLRDSASSMEMIAESVACDPGIASKLLHLSNSPLFSRSLPVANVRDALCVLGLETFAQLVLVSEVFEIFDRLRVHAGIEVSWLEERAMRLSMMMKELFIDPRDTATAATVGAIHDIGILLLMQGEGDYDAVQQTVASGTMSRAAAEIATYGFCHGEAAAALARAWDLPEALIEALATHERLTKNPQNVGAMALGLKISEDLLEGQGDLDGNVISMIDDVTKQDPDLGRRATRMARR